MVNYIAPDSTTAAWQRRLEGGEPRDLTPDDLMILGLTAESFAEEDSIKALLRAESLLAESEGEYRLVVHLPDGGTLESDWVPLLLKPTETPKALPEESGDVT